MIGSLWRSLPAALFLCLLTLPAAAKPALRARHSRNGHYAIVRGLRMYYEDHGRGPVVLFLHGGGETIESSFAPQIPFFARRYRVIAPEQMGQGHTPDKPRPLSYNDMTEDTAALLRHLKITRCDIVGWSDGGILGLMLAQRYPKLVRRLVASGANYHPDGLTPAAIKWLHTVKPEKWGPARGFYARVSPDGLGHWPVMVEKLKKLWLEYPVPSELSVKSMSTIRCPVLVMAGDHDVISTEHTVEIQKSIHNANLCILADTPHETFTHRPEMINSIILNFLTKR